MARPRRSLILLALLALVTLAGACSSSNDKASDDGATTTTAIPEVTLPSGGMGTMNPDQPGALCDAKMPGEPMTAEEAHVTFTSERVCPGYVTVVLGTPVTWTNEGSATYTITIKDGPTPDSTVIATKALAPGETWTYSFVEIKQYTWTTDALESFVGAVEVQDTSGMSHGA